MKKQFNNISKNMVLSSLVASTVLMGGAGSVLANGISNTQISEAEYKAQETKYSKQVMRAVRESLGGDAKSAQLDLIIKKTPKVEVMDLYLSAFGKKVKGNEIRLAVKEIFDIDLDIVSKNDYGSKVEIYPAAVMESLRVSFNEQPNSAEQDASIMALTKNEVMDRYIKEHQYGLSGAESRVLINQIFGVNLDGISTLEHAQLAINSKGQWIVESDTDLFILESSLDDVDVSIYATSYFEEVTGSDELPESLVAKIVDLGFTYDQEAELLYYKNPTGESVPDEFKGQVISIIVGTIMTEYAK